MRRTISFLPLVALVVLGTLSCDNEKEEVKESGPKVSTLDPEKGTFGVVTLSGSISGFEVVSYDFVYGMEYSTDESFSDENSTFRKVGTKYTEQPYSITASGFQHGKKYYYRAYCVNQSQLYY
jgi:hypothetical protein